MLDGFEQAIIGGQLLRFTAAAVVVCLQVAHRALRAASALLDVKEALLAIRMGTALHYLG